jgi:hypothetical protein
MTKFGTTVFLRGFLVTVLLTFSTTVSAATSSEFFLVRGLRTVFFAGAASAVSASAFFLRPRLGFSAGASAAVAAVVSAETASTVFSTAGCSYKNAEKMLKL